MNATPQPPPPGGPDKPADPAGGWLGIAGKVAGLLAGIVALVYLLGGLVIALRMLFDGFSAAAVVTLLGQLPRELVVSTALLEVIGPAATVGLAAALLYGGLNRPQPRRGTDDRLDRGRCPALTFVVLAAISIALTLPAFVQAAGTDGLSALLFVGVGFGLLVTFGLAAAGWFLIRRTGRRTTWFRLTKAVAAGAIWAGMALVPAVMLAGALEFEEAQVCTGDSVVPANGDLIGETSDRIFLATDFEDEESVLSLPADRVTKSEYGDLSSHFVCTAAAETEGGGGETTALGGHGSETEIALAASLRPHLLFDRDERWRPLEVGRFVGERFEDGSGHGACAGGADPPCPAPTGVEGLRGGAIAYLDIHGRAANGADSGSPPSDCKRAPPAVDCEDGPTSVIYYRRTTNEDRWYWDYWWFLRYNDYTGKVNRCRIVCGDHEGDWEGVTVITTASAQPTVLGTIYATHKDRVLVDAAIMPAAGTHPLVFVADGTHAAYPFACRAECRQYTKLGTNLPEESHDGAAAWVHNSEESCAAALCVRPLPEGAGAGEENSLPRAAAWAAWRGLWGETCHAGCGGAKNLFESSPRSPGLQVRYRCPWIPTLRATPGTEPERFHRSIEVGDRGRMLAACLARHGSL